MTKKEYVTYIQKYLCEIDKICIKGVLWDYFKKDNEIIKLNSYENKIYYYKSICKKNISNSEIIDNYMRFTYSSLEYKIYPIIKIGMDLHNAYPEWKFGENVLDTIGDFNKQYNTRILGVSNLENYSNEQKIILQSLKDYGILINNDTINLEMIIEIEDRLNVRYSTYDIINAIKFLAKNSKNNKQKFKNLNDKYID